MKVKLAIGSVVLLAIAFIVNTTFLRSALSADYQVTEIKRLLIPMELASDAVEKALGNNDRRLSVTDMREILERQQQAINRHWESNRKPDPRNNHARANDLVNLSIVLKSGSSLVSTVEDIVHRDTSPAILARARIC